MVINLLTFSLALCIAYQNPQQFRTLLRNIGGIILLGCPHTTSNNIDDWQNISAILRSFLKSKSKHVLTRQATEGLAADCLGFVQAMDKVPVLSMFETEKARAGMVSRKTVRQTPKYLYLRRAKPDTMTARE